MNKSREILIYPARVHQYESPRSLVPKVVPYDLYEDAIQNRSIGDHLCAFAAAPGTGKIVHEITRMDHTGVYGVVVENTISILDPADVY